MAFPKGNTYGRGNGFKKGNRLWDNLAVLVSSLPRAKQFKKAGSHPSFSTEFKKGDSKSEKWLSVVKARVGEKNPAWKGGITLVNKKIRKSVEYKLWRNSVFERDNFTCVWCGTVGTVLHADHIKPFSLFPELRFAIDNGRTLCVPCHRTTDTYGGRIYSNNITLQKA